MAPSRRRAPQIHAKLRETGFFSELGIVLNQATPYAKAAAQFPLTAQSFVTPDIPASDAATVYQDLANHLPPLLVPLASDPKQATVARIVQASTDLSFLFAGQADAPNKRNQVLSILLATSATSTSPSSHSRW